MNSDQEVQELVENLKDVVTAISNILRTSGRTLSQQKRERLEQLHHAIQDNITELEETSQ